MEIAVNQNNYSLMYWCLRHERYYLDVNRTVKDIPLIVYFWRNFPIEMFNYVLSSQININLMPLMKYSIEINNMPLATQILEWVSNKETYRYGVELDINEDKELFNYIFELYSDKNKQSILNLWINFLIKDCNYDLNNGSKTTLLVHAVLIADFDLIFFLLAKKADIEKHSPLVFAIENENLRRKKRYRYFKVIKLLLKRGAKTDYCHKSNNTILYNVFNTTQDKKLIKLLIKYGADINAKIGRDCPINIALKNNDIELARFILSFDDFYHGRAIEHEYNYSEFTNILTHACIENKIEFAELILYNTVSCVCCFYGKYTAPLICATSSNFSFDFFKEVVDRWFYYGQNGKLERVRLYHSLTDIIHSRESSEDEIRLARMKYKYMERHDRGLHCRVVHIDNCHYCKSVFQ